MFNSRNAALVGAPIISSLTTYIICSSSFTKVSENISNALSKVNKIGSTVEGLDESKKENVLKKVRLAVTVLPTGSVGAGSLFGSLAAHRLLQFRVISNFRVFKVFPLFAVFGGTCLGGIVGVKSSAGALLSIGNKAVLGVVLEQVGFPEWLVNLLV